MLSATNIGIFKIAIKKKKKKKKINEKERKKKRKKALLFSLLFMNDVFVIYYKTKI